MSVGSNIKKRRYELRLSQQDLADALGYKTRSTIAKIESGENDISQRKLVKFAEALDTTIEALSLGVPSNPSFTNISKSMFSETEHLSHKRNRTVAIILAGGKSNRNQQNIPNQFINILGKPVIAYCMDAYQNHPAIDDIYIICLKGWEQIVTSYAEQYNITKLRGFIPGASSGLLSIKNGLEYLCKHYCSNDIVIFQESTRPLITFDIISKLLQSCYENNAVILCQSMKEYLQFSFDKNIASYIDRESAVCVQSPEAYRLETINEVFEKAQKKQLPLSDSCCAMLMYNLGYKINFVQNSANNIKIVHQEDVAIATALLHQYISKSAHIM